MIGSSAMPFNAFLDGPFIEPIRMHVAMSGKKATSMFPEQRPKLFLIGLRQLECGEFSARKEFERPFAMSGRADLQPRPDFEKKHEPMGLTLIAMLTDETTEVQIFRVQFQSQFLPTLAAGASIRRFAVIGMQFSAAGTPKSPIRFVQPLDQQHLVPIIKTIKECRDFVGEHRISSSLFFQTVRGGGSHLPAQYNLCPVRMNTLPWLRAIEDRN